MEELRSQKRRRAFLLLLGFAGFAFASRGAMRLADRLDAGFDFVELEQPHGFRKIQSGDQSVLLDPFVGLDVDEDPIPEAKITDIEGELFYARSSPAKLQVAYFSDLYCPYCRVLSQQIIDLRTELDFDMSWQELPILSDASVVAAKGQIAAGQQGQYIAFHKVLVRRPVQVTYEYLAKVAGDLNLDLARFEADFESAETLRAIGRGKALADLFGVFGTPALIVGRTLVIGQISQTNLRQLIMLESAEA